MTRFIEEVRTDWQANSGLSLDSLKARLLTAEIRGEQAAYRWRQASPGPVRNAAWAAIRFAGSIVQWRLFSCEIPGSAQIGRGLRLPHPQNIIIGYTASIGDSCSIYHNTTVARSTFRSTSSTARIGDRVLIGAGAIIVGEVEIGDDAVVAAGAVVTHSVPAAHLVVSPQPELRPRSPLPGAEDAEFRYPNPHPRARAERDSAEHRG